MISILVQPKGKRKKECCNPAREGVDFPVSSGLLLEMISSPDSYSRFFSISDLACLLIRIESAKTMMCKGISMEAEAYLDR